MDWLQKSTINRKVYSKSIVNGSDKELDWSYATTMYVDLFGFGFHVSYTSDTAVTLIAPLWLLQGSAAVAVVAVELTVVTPLVYRTFALAATQDKKTLQDTYQMY